MKRACIIIITAFFCIHGLTAQTPAGNETTSVDPDPVVSLEHELRSQQNSSEYNETLKEYLQLVPIKSGLSFLESEMIDFKGTRDNFYYVAIHAARLSELAGALYKAASYYEKAANIRDTSHTEIEQAMFLYYETGYFEKANRLSEVLLGKSNKKIKASAYAVKALLLEFVGRRQDSVNLLERAIAAGYESPRVYGAVWYLQGLFGDSESPRFSPETLKTVKQSMPEKFHAAPGTPLLIKNEGTENSESEAAAGPEAGTGRYYIKTGTFSDRENAEYMVLSLQKLGLSGDFLEKEVDGSVVYSVLVTATDRNNAGETLEFLRENNFDGIILKR